MTRQRTCHFFLNFCFVPVFAGATLVVFQWTRKGHRMSKLYKLALFVFLFDWLMLHSISIMWWLVCYATDEQLKKEISRLGSRRGCYCTQLPEMPIKSGSWVQSQKRSDIAVPNSWLYCSSITNYFFQVFHLLMKIVLLAGIIVPHAKCKLFV